MRGDARHRGQRASRKPTRATVRSADHRSDRDHTPGSILAFITLPSQRRLLLLGDLVWQTDGITRPAERPWIARRQVDTDPKAVRDAIAHVAALQRHFPELTLLPAPEARAWSRLPVFPAYLE